jgi:hypothetical protein
MEILSLSNGLSYYRTIRTLWRTSHGVEDNKRTKTACMLQVCKFRSEDSPPEEDL